MMVRISLLGSTGSIGRQTLEVIAAYPERFELVALTAWRNSALLREQVARFRPSMVVVADTREVHPFHGLEVLTGTEGLIAAATHPDADLVVIALAGNAALEPTLAAAHAGKTIALANKESVVCAGELLMAAIRRGRGQLRPIDSEHSALWQLLHLPHQRAELHSVTLTASGGPFLATPLDRLSSVTPADAL